jgi:TonB family protein
MFNVVVDRRRRGVWSARTVAVSVGAHLLVLAGVVSAAANARVEPIRNDTTYVLADIPEKAKAPTPVAPTPPPPPTERHQVKGDFVSLPTPREVPKTLPPPAADPAPFNADDFSARGREGDVRGKPDSTPQPPTGNTQPAPREAGAPFEPGEVDQLPQLANPREAQRMLERVYPGMLRDAGVTGHTTVLLVIDKTGAVEPGSVTVQESTHDAFRDAAVRAAEHFRFRPARLQGEPVSVIISLPIEWQIRP